LWFTFHNSQAEFIKPKSAPEVRLRKHLKFFVLILLAITILWLFGRNLDWSKVKEYVAEADARLLVIATLIVCSTYLIRAFRWRTLLEPLTKASLRPLFIATTVGFGSVFVFGRAGEVVRPVVLSLRDRKVRPAAAFVTIMVERLCDTVVVVIFFALSLLWVKAPPGHALEFTRVRYIGLGLLGAALLGLLGLAWFRRKSGSAIQGVDRLLKKLSFVPERVTHGITATLEQLATALGILADPRELVRVTFWSVLLWAVILVAYWLVLKAFGLPFGPAESIFVMGFAMIGSLVPTPGGAAGAFEAATAAGLMLLSITKDQAAAVALITHLILFAPALGFGLYYLLRGEISIARLRQMTTPEAVEHAVEDEKIELDEKKKVPIAS
jgi:uncharacterized protein (TIRG00374 family)